MMTALRLVWIAFFVIALFTTFQLPSVKSCSGGLPPVSFADEVSSADYIVQARIVQVDEAGANAILEVEEYLSGQSGPRFILWRATPRESTNWSQAGRFSGGSCSPPGAFARLSLNFPALYFFLQREPMGSYAAFRVDFAPSDYGDSDMSQTQIYIVDGAGDLQMVTIELSEYLQLVSDLVGEDPAEPLLNTPPPIVAPLLLTTEGDVMWMLPVDGGPPVPWGLQDTVAQIVLDGIDDAGTCDTPDCQQISEDGITTVLQTDSQTITTNDGWQVNGQAFLMSPTSDSVVVWNDCKLIVYGLHYPRFILGGRIQPLNEQTLKPTSGTTCSNLALNAAWSPDGRTLAYIDADGLWLWDTLLTDVQPRLLLGSEGESLPIPVDFSPTGRHLRIQSSEGRFYLDLLHSEQRLPDGTISPDERLIVILSDSASSGKNQICTINMNRCQELYSSAFVQEIIWLRDRQFIGWGCLPEQANECVLDYWYPAMNPEDTYWDGGWSREPAYLVVYDYETDLLAILRDESTLIIGDQVYDLTGKLPAPIIDMEWMPALMYRYG